MALNLANFAITLLRSLAVQTRTACARAPRSHAIIKIYVKDAALDFLLASSLA